MARQKRNIAEKYNSVFATRLRQIIQERDITQDSIATHIGVSRQTVSQYANGISDPSFETLGKIADYFNVTTDYLLGRTNDPSPHPSAVNDLKLSPDAVKNLMEYNDSILYLNKLLEHDSFNYFIGKINYLAQVIAAEHEFNNLPEDDLIEASIDDGDLQIELENNHPGLEDRVYVASGEEAIKIFKILLTNEFSDLLNEITQYAPYGKDK